jgi:hypothetical protein
VSIRWPNGDVETFTDLAINTTHVIEQGTITAVPQFAPGTLTLAPNPVQDRITFTGAEPNSTYEVLDAAGHIVLTGRATNGLVPVQALSDGAYVLRVTGTDGVRSARFVKQ